MRKSVSTSLETSPAKLVASELEALRRALRVTGARFVERMDTQVGLLLDQTVNLPPGAQTRELRDMLMLVRGLDLKPEAGRRKDLKKIEAAVAELQVLSQKW